MWVDGLDPVGRLAYLFFHFEGTIRQGWQCVVAYQCFSGLLEPHMLTFSEGFSFLPVNIGHLQPV